MLGLSKVVVLDPDARAGRQVQLGFMREGVHAELAAVPGEGTRLELPGEQADLLVVGGSGAGGIELVRRARQVVEQQQLNAPIVFAGRDVARADVEAAGADAVVLQPAFLRDVVTIGRLLRGQPAGGRAHLAGNLAETTGVLTLVRALSALGRSAVLTLIRGLRRGEVRFFHGEVTSAQVGVIHGQAALHQLLMWTDARFDYRQEDVVRRQQIPLDHDELFADAERFLAGVRDASGGLSPSMILEQDVARIQLLGKQVPGEVQGVLRMFDGHRVLADVLEDSPYRVFETLRVSQRALDVGLLRRTTTAARPKATWRAVLAIEEWLVGTESRDDVLDRAVLETGPVPKTDPGSSGSGSGKSKGNSRRKRKKRRANTPVALPVLTKGPDIDWGSLVPRTLGAEVGPLAGVIPAAQQSGEITSAPGSTRDAPREKLEAMMDTGKRERIFPTDIGLEPSVVLEAAPAPVPAPAADRAPSTSELVHRLLEEDRGASGAARTVETPSVVVAETPHATVTVADTLVVTTTDTTARLVASPSVTVTEPAPAAPRAPSGDAALASMVATPFERVDLSTEPAPAAPIEPADETSDGVIRSRHSNTVQTAPVQLRRPPPGEIPADDRPHDTTGEIRPAERSAPIGPRASEPSILIADQVSELAADLTADLATVHSAVSAVASRQAAAPATASIETAARDTEVGKARRDATAAFSQMEEEFFRAGHDETHPPRLASASDSFDDLDDGYQPAGFWDRLLGRKRKR